MLLLAMVAMEEMHACWLASGEDARRIYQIGTQYRTVDETLANLGYAPNRRAGERGTPVRPVTGAQRFGAYPRLASVSSTVRYCVPIW